MTPHEQALRVAREYFLEILCLDAEDPDHSDDALALASLLERREAAAVAEIAVVLPETFHESMAPVCRVALLVKERQDLLAARPGIERAARIEALEWVADQTWSNEGHVRGEIEAKLKKLGGDDAQAK
mgnify:CR=1 FL=1